MDRKCILAATLCFLCTGLAFQACAQSQQNNGEQVTVREIVEVHSTPPRVPDFAVFAGDTVWLDDQDRYERMDRELVAFTYGHTNSVLMLKRAERMFSRVVPKMVAKLALACSKSRNVLYEPVKWRTNNNSIPTVPDNTVVNPCNAFAPIGNSEPAIAPNCPRIRVNPLTT